MSPARPEQDQQRDPEPQPGGPRSLQPGPTPAGPGRPVRRPPRRRASTFLGLALILAAVAALGVWRWRAAAAKAQPQLETVKIDRGRIVAKVTATGTLSAIVTVQVGSQVSGRIQALYADFNSRVRKGQLIAKIDPQLFQAAREQARANLIAAEGNLAKARAQAVDARRQYGRSQALAEQKLIATAERDTAQATSEAAEATVQAARGTVEQARAALHQAEVNLAYTDIVSPTSGVVISRSVDVGQTVAASLQAPTLFVIAEDLAKMQVDTSVSEADVGRLRDGMRATFTVDAHPAETFRGTVRQIRNAPQTVQNVVTYDAVVDVENPELKLRPGMTANVTFVYAERDDVLRVPNAGLRFKPPPELLARAPGQGGQPGATGQNGQGARPGNGGGTERGAGPAARRAAERSDQRTIWVVRDRVPQPVRVRTGISDGSLTELVEGEVSPGDVVVTDVVGAPSAGSATGGPAQGMRRPF